MGGELVVEDAEAHGDEGGGGGAGEHGAVGFVKGESEKEADGGADEGDDDEEPEEVWRDAVESEPDGGGERAEEEGAAVEEDGSELSKEAVWGGIDEARVDGDGGGVGLEFLGRGVDEGMAQTVATMMVTKRMRWKRGKARLMRSVVWLRQRTASDA